MASQRHIMVVDPSVKRGELESYNRLLLDSPIGLTYHLPVFFGMSSMKRVADSAVGIILFGSASSVNERTDWQTTLEEWLRPMMERKIPTLGICYGHQMLAHMFGGRVEYHSPTKMSHKGMRRLTLEPDPLWGGKSLEGEMHVSHNEIVSKAPADMKVVGHSPAVAIEALAHKSLPIWSFQPHPEAAPGSSQYGNFGDIAKDQFGYQRLLDFIHFVERGSA